MKITITIEEEKEARVRIEPAGTAEGQEASAEDLTEAKPTSAGGPPPWLLQELQGEAAGVEEAQASHGALDAGPAPTADGTGLAARPAGFARES